MRIAFLADIHGNLPALEAVLADLTTQAPDAAYLLGDLINRCPWNNDVMDCLTERGWPSIYGNHEVVIGRLGTPQNQPPFTDRARFPTLWWTADQLAPQHMQTIRQLPAELRLDLDAGPPIRLLHGKPGNPFVGFLPELRDERLVDEVATIAESVVVCAHTHRPLLRTVHCAAGETEKRTWHIFNGGSVGLPYNGDPRAQYLLLDSDGGQWRPTLRRVDYDRSGLAAAFAASGMVDDIGPLAELHLRTALTGDPWTSDFSYWMSQQPAARRLDGAAAVEVYLRDHGPGRWAFALDV